MNYRYYLRTTSVALSSLIIFGCQSPDFSLLKTKSIELVKMTESSVADPSEGNAILSEKPAKSLNQILNDSPLDRNKGTDFKSSIVVALNNDPSLTVQRQTVAAALASIDSSEAKKNYQVTGTLYGGFEDITDNTKGAALGLNASRLIFDGGLVDAEIASKGFQAEAARLNLQAALEGRAYKLGASWLELEKYENLQMLIDARLAILEPLIDQLEQVAKAGIGDVSKVTAAQRTVSGIRVTQTSIAEGLAKAKLEYLSLYGSVQKNIEYDARFISALIPDKIHDGLGQKSPALLAKYASYNAALARLAAARAKGEFNVGFEAKAMRPFAGSEYESDESIGFVARKTLFNGGMLESEIVEAEAMAEAAMAEVEATYKQGVRMIKSAKQSIESMEKAIELARDNAKVTADEIVYLRQQLVIGGSTLDNVLSAEARLYDAESKEITFIADKRKAELLIASTLGLIGPALGY